MSELFSAAHAHARTLAQSFARTKAARSSPTEGPHAESTTLLDESVGVIECEACWLSSMHVVVENRVGSGWVGVCKARAWADWQDNVGICSLAQLSCVWRRRRRRGEVLFCTGWRGCKRRVSAVDFTEYFICFPKFVHGYASLIKSYHTITKLYTN